MSVNGAGGCISLLPEVPSGAPGDGAARMGPSGSCSWLCVAKGSRWHSATGLAVTHLSHPMCYLSQGARVTPGSHISMGKQRDPEVVQGFFCFFAVLTH